MSDDLFIHPHVLDFTGDKYQLITLTMRWAKTLKSRGSSEPMQALIEKSLMDLVEKRITAEEIMATPVPVVEKKDEVADVLPIVSDKPGSMTLPPDDEEDTDTKKKTKKKKDA